MSKKWTAEQVSHCRYMGHIFKTSRTNNPQAANQYGFTVNKSSEEAIVDFIDEIKIARSTKQHALVISLDIKGAFVHLEYNSFKSSLNNINFHPNTKETLIDLLSGRQVALNTLKDQLHSHNIGAAHRARALVQHFGILARKEFICKPSQMTSSFL
ncbi:hypothetical protein AVEN_269600-1 [Araneus ventricosus]|uniref:Reverse transcriptase domain-containing protein n=1 Tax=Araneus ventricosus TaxID=182803 RepID=A0A4Y2CCP7_ARAVE|nr:hypothetical protein AVEN_269600-1 [Araneus ventricosus]